MAVHIGHDSLMRNTNMPIAQVHKRNVQSATNGMRNLHFSAHHVRQMTKLSAATTSQSQSHQQNKSLMVTTGSPKSTISTRSSAVNTFDAKKKLDSVFKSRAANAHTAGGGAQSPVARPISSGAFKPRKIEPTRFRYFYDRGDLPLRVNFAGAVRKLQWRVDLTKLDYAHYLPMFMEGLRDLDEPYQFPALNGTMDLLEKGENRTLACLAHLILTMKQNLMTRHPTVLCVQLKVLQKMVRSCPYIGEALVPYYRQLLSIFNLFITKRVNCGDATDYAQRRQENLGDLILETLYLLETHGGSDAFVNIKYVPADLLAFLWRYSDIH
ncbi:putative mitochondrial protein, partial [Globisporangium splendens]